MADEQIDRLSIDISAKGADSTANSLDKLADIVERLIQAIQPISQHFAQLSQGVERAAQSISSSVERQNVSVTALEATTTSKLQAALNSYEALSRQVPLALERIQKAEKALADDDGNNTTQLEANLGKAQQAYVSLQKKITSAVETINRETLVPDNTGVDELIQSGQEIDSQITRLTVLLEASKSRVGELNSELLQTREGTQAYSELTAQIDKTLNSISAIEEKIDTLNQKKIDIANEQNCASIEETQTAITTMGETMLMTGENFSQAFDDITNTSESFMVTLGNIEDMSNSALEPLRDGLVICETEISNLGKNAQRLAPAFVTPLQRVSAQLEATRTNITALETKWQELAVSENNASITDRSQVAQQLDKEYQKLEQLEKKYEELQNQNGSANISTGDGGKSISDNINSAIPIVSMFSSRLGGALGTVTRLASQFAKMSPYILAAVGLVGALVLKMKLTLKTGKALFDIFRKIGGAVIDRIKEKISSLITPINNLLKQIKRVVLNRLIREGFNLVQKGIAEGIKNAALGYEYANKVLSQYATQNLYLKNVLGSSLIPLLQSLYPLFETITNAVIKASNAINQFLSLLNGKGTYIKAQKQYVDYASTVDSSSKKAKKSVQNLTASFDELHDITESASDVDENEMTNYFTETGIEADVNGFYKKIVEGFKKGDLSEVGKILADKLNSAIANIDRKINWQNVGERIAKGARAIGTAITSFTQNFDFGNLGKTIGDGLTTIINALVEFDKTLIEGNFFTNLGSGIGEALYGMIANINWEGLGELLLNKITNAFDVLKGFTNKMSETIEYVLGDGKDAQKKQAPRIVAMVDQIFYGLKTALENNMTKFEDIGQTVADFLVVAFEFGTAVFSNGDFWKTLAEAINSIIKKLSDNKDEIAPKVSEFVKTVSDWAVDFLDALDINLLVNTICDIFSDVLSDPEVQTSLQRLFGKLGDIARTAFTGALKMLNTVLYSGLNGMLNRLLQYSGIYTTSTSKITHRARGGVLPDDSLVAVSSGELIGKMSNGNTVAANNLMIQQGIEKAAYSGVLRAMQESGTTTANNNSSSNVGDIYINSHKAGKYLAKDVADELVRSGYLDKYITNITSRR